MYIMSERGDEILLSEHVQRFRITRKPDGCVIHASYSTETTPVLVGRYKTLEEAQSALYELYYALAGEATHFHMPLSSYYEEERRIHDSRRDRRGGS